MFPTSLPGLSKPSRTSTQKHVNHWDHKADWLLNISGFSGGASGRCLEVFDLFDGQFLVNLSDYFLVRFLTRFLARVLNGDFGEGNTITV